MDADFLTTLSFLTIAKKNRDKAMKLVIANISSKSDDSMSGIKRSSREIIVWTANNPKAIATNKIFLTLVFDMRLMTKQKEWQQKFHFQNRIFLQHLLCPEHQDHHPRHKHMANLY